MGKSFVKHLVMHGDHVLLGVDIKECFEIALGMVWLSGICPLVGIL